MQSNHTAETLAATLKQADVRVAVSVDGSFWRDIGRIAQEGDKFSLYLDVIPVGWDGVAALMPPEIVDGLPVIEQEAQR